MFFKDLKIGQMFLHFNSKYIKIKPFITQNGNTVDACYINPSYKVQFFLWPLHSHNLIVIQ